MTRIVLLVVALAGCGGGTKSQPPPAAPVENKAETAPAPPPEPTLEEKAEAMVQAMEELGNIIERHQASCADMEREIRAYAERNREVFLRMKDAKPSEEENRRLMELYGPRVEAVLPKLMYISNCPGAAQAMQEIPM